MKSIKEISLLNTESPAASSGGDIFPPIIKGFSTLAYPIYSTGEAEGYVSYLQIDKFPSTTPNKYRGVIVEGYVRPVNQTTGINSNRIGLPFTHYAMLIPSITQGGEVLEHGIIGGRTYFKFLSKTQPFSHLLGYKLVGIVTPLTLMRTQSFILLQPTLFLFYLDLS